MPPSRPEGDDPALFTAFIDFSASPFALGDILTWNIRVCCEAQNAGATAMDVLALTDPDLLGNGFQNFITPANYEALFLELMPAFLANPMLRDFRHLRQREPFEHTMFVREQRGQGVFPGFTKYAQGVRSRRALYSGHAVMNRFFGTRGFLPHLAMPAPVRGWAEDFVAGFGPGLFPVAVHVRRRAAVPHMRGGAPGRDGEFAVWEAFLVEAGRRHPETRFLLLGKPAEWPRQLLRLPGVVPLKTLGCGLLEELAVLQACRLFMGVASGPCIMALFSAMPYVIFQQCACAKDSAGIMEVPIGTRRIPFAGEHQAMVWETPTPALLLEEFEAQHAVWRDREGRL